MDSVHAMRDILAQQGVSQAEFARTLGLKKGTLTARLAPERASSLSVATLNQMCRVVGYKVVLIPAAVKAPGFELDDGLEDPLQ